MAPRRGGGGLSRRAALALIGGGGLLGISSTGAFDQVRGQRPFDLSVDDDDALLGIELFSPIEISSSPATVDILELQNRFPDTELTELTVSSDSTILSVESLDGVTLQSGKTEMVRGTISVSESGQSVVDLTVTATTETERIETTRSIEINATVTGYEPGTCPVSVNVGADALPKREGGSITVTDQDVADGIEAGGSVSINSTGNRFVIIGGDVEADGAISITANSNDATVIIDGSVESGGTIDISAGGNITIGGDMEADGDITITAKGSGTITICGEVESEDGELTITENGNASVTINDDDDEDEEDDDDDEDEEDDDDDEDEEDDDD